MTQKQVEMIVIQYKLFDREKVSRTCECCNDRLEMNLDRGHALDVSCTFAKVR